jgi:dihydroxy-acid dehydratase
VHATGLTPDQLNLPQVGISSVWYEGNPCNMHLNDLSASVKKGVQKAGLVGFRFNTIGVSDGISMGTEGMCYSLQSREIIADSIETVMSAQWLDIKFIRLFMNLQNLIKYLFKRYDANISLPGCDKNMPGCLIAMARLDRPSLIVYGGTIKAGSSCTNKPLDIVSAFQSYGEFLAGRITEEDRVDIVRNACPGAGACGGMYTANSSEYIDL